MRKETPRPANGDDPTGHEDLPQEELKSDVRGEIQETTEVLGIPRDRWGCQKLVITTNPEIPTNRV